MRALKNALKNIVKLLPGIRSLAAQRDHFADEMVEGQRQRAELDDALAAARQERDQLADEVAEGQRQRAELDKALAAARRQQARRPRRLGAEDAATSRPAKARAEVVSGADPSEPSPRDDHSTPTGTTKGVPTASEDRAEKMTRTYYQTHSDTQQGMVDSEARLERLNYPADLTGQRVLDIGCNEGFFCNVAAERNAAEVIGIDGNLPFLEIARELYSAPNVEFRHQRWDTLPDGPFDLVLWTSSMHYELDPTSVFANIRRILSPDGLFILECGVFDWSTKEMVLSQRSSDSRWYPTRPFLHEMLKDHFAFRRVTSGVVIPGDAVPRVVYHCKPPTPVVLLVRGEGGRGKTYLGEMLTPAATKVITIDGVLNRIARGKHFNTDFERFIHKMYEEGHLGNIYSIIDREDRVDEYVDVLVQTIARSDKLVVIEGHLTDEQAAALTARLETVARVWDTSRRA